MCDFARFKQFNVKILHVTA